MKKKNKDNKIVFYDENKETFSQNRAFNIFVTLILMIFCIVATYIVTNYYVSQKLLSQTELNDNIQTKINEIRDIIDKKYLYEVNENEILDKTLEGYVDGLDDKYSVYYTKDEYQELLNDISGDYVGIGIIVGKSTDSKMVIISVIDESPAKEVGIEVGDIIQKVNNIEVTKDNYIEMIDSIKGEQNTNVVLSILRDEKVLEKTVTRRAIVTNPVTSKMIDENIGYVKYSSFDDTATSQYIEATKKLKQEGMTKLILDLRDNGGGLLSSLKQVAGTILPQNTIIMYQQDKQGNLTPEITSSIPYLEDTQIVVLVNENSASASEVLTAALKDLGRATIVGKTTYGKGVVQEIFRLSQGDALKLTISEYLTPNKTHINNVGVKPDYEIEIDQDKNADPQLDKAIEILK